MKIIVQHKNLFLEYDMTEIINNVDALHKKRSTACNSALKVLVGTPKAHKNIKEKNLRKCNHGE